MRPLALEFPDDPQVVNMSDQYLFGPDLLVAPVLEQGATQRTVYLPAGGWIDFRTDQIIEGPRYVTVPAPLDSLPLFIRRGAIIPMGPDMQYSGERPLDPLTLEIYRGGDRSFILYEDDGETTAYQTGAYAETGLEVRANADSLLCLIGEVRGGFAGYHPKRSIVLNVHQQGAVKEVNCNGAALAAAADRAALERMAAGWWWSETVRLLRVKFRHTDRSSIVRVS
jgi:hypothetical protein